MLDHVTQCNYKDIEQSRYELISLAISLHASVDILYLVQIHVMWSTRAIREIHKTLCYTEWLHTLSVALDVQPLATHKHHYMLYTIEVHRSRTLVHKVKYTVAPATGGSMQHGFWGNYAMSNNVKVCLRILELLDNVQEDNKWLCEISPHYWSL